MNTQAIENFCLMHFREHLNWFAKYLDTFSTFIDKNFIFPSYIILKKKPNSDEASLNEDLKL